MRKLDEATIGEMLSREGYDLIKEIGAGGQARVFMVHDRHLCQDVALKMYIGDEDDSRALLAHEYSFLRMHDHPHLPKVFDLRSVNWNGLSFIWFTMELCMGSLSSRLSEQEVSRALATGSDITREMIKRVRSNPNPRLTAVRRYHVMELRQRILCIIEFLDVLSFIHMRELAHRDLKPGNILVSPQGHLKLADFGTARRVVPDHNASFIGTPEYIAPELWPSKDKDDEQPRMNRVINSLLADEYSAGITIAQLLQRGDLPTSLRDLPELSHETAIQYVMAHRGGVFEPVQIPECVQTPSFMNDVLQRMMSPKPDRRYGNISRCVTELLTAVVKDDL